jgi:hypothetical protein
MQFKWKRQQWSGTYWASTDNHKFAIDKIGSTWQLRVWQQPTLDTPSKLIVISDDFPTMKAAKADAQTFADKQGA